MSRDIKKSRIYYDTKGVKAYDKIMTEKYKHRKHPDNVFPEGITDAEFRKAIIDIFCGVDWFISYPASQTQVNEEAIETIIESITNKSAAKRLMENNND